MGNAFSCNVAQEDFPSRCKPMPKIPHEDEVNRCYVELLKERHISQAVRDEMVRIETLSSKWYLVYFNRKAIEDNVKVSAWAAKEYVEQLLTLQYGGRGLIELLQNIQINMTTYSRAWVEEFLCFGGVDALVLFMPEPASCRDPVECVEVLKVLTALVNYSSGANHIIRAPMCIIRLIFCLDLDDDAVLKRALQLLGVLCYHNADGHRTVLHSFDECRVFKKEHVRFQSLTKNLTANTFDIAMKTSIMKFINILITTAEGLEERIAIRTDLSHHRLMQYVDAYRFAPHIYEFNDTFDEQLRIFEAQYKSDRESSFYQGVDLADVEQVFDALYSRTTLTEVHHQFLRVLRDLLKVPTEEKVGKDLWELVEKAVTYITNHDSNSPLDESKLQRLRSQVSKLTDEMQIQVAIPNCEAIKNEASSPVSTDSLPSVDDDEVDVDNIHKTKSTAPTSSIVPKPPAIDENDAKESELRVTASTNVLASLLQKKLDQGIEPTSNMKSSAGVDDSGDLVMIKDHPKYKKYFMLLKFMQPIEQVRLKAIQDGVDPNKLDLDPQTLVPVESGKKASKKLVKASEHPEYKKYFDLLRFGMDVEQAKCRMSADGKPPDILDEPEALLPIKDTVPRAKDDPRYARFFKLLSMGVDEEAVKEKMKQAGLNPNALDAPDLPVGQPSLSLQDALKSKTLTGATHSPVPLSRQNSVRRKIRSLYWDVVPSDQLVGTIWDKDASSDTEVRLDDTDVAGLTSLFRFESSSPKKDLQRTMSQSRIFLLDRARSNNISIVLKSIKMDLDELTQAILELDETKLPFEKVQSLLNIAPTPDEKNIITSFRGDAKKLNEAEKFYLQMLTVPRYTTRLSAFATKYQYQGLADDVDRTIEKVERACLEIQSCSSLTIILKVVLNLGNLLNDGTSRGKARGFKIANLPKLNQLKGVDNKMTLMHYLAKILRQKQTSLLGFGKALPTVHEIRAVSIAEIPANVKKLAKSCLQIASEMSAHETQVSQSRHKDLFQSVMTPFLKQAQEIYNRIDKKQAEMENTVAETTSLFGEVQSNPIATADGFFDLICGFSESLVQADKENETRRILEEKRVEREKQNAHRRIFRRRDTSPAQLLTPTIEKTEELSRGSSLRGFGRLQALRNGGGLFSSLKRHSVQVVPSFDSPETEEPVTTENKCPNNRTESRIMTIESIDVEFQRDQEESTTSPTIHSLPTTPRRRSIDRGKVRAKLSTMLNQASRETDLSHS